MDTKVKVRIRKDEHLEISIKAPVIGTSSVLEWTDSTGLSHRISRSGNGRYRHEWQRSNLIESFGWTSPTQVPASVVDLLLDLVKVARKAESLCNKIS